jgi:hypothetical protein
MTPCNKSRAMGTVNLFSDAKLYYHFDIYNLTHAAYNEDILKSNILSGKLSDALKVYNGFSYGTINIGLIQWNFVMYSNITTGRYSMIQFADFDLGGGIVTDNVNRLFERSISHVDNF